MSGLDELRAATAQMRARAQAASPGPWVAHPDGLVWADRLGDPVSGSECLEDAEHIAGWHPPVALAVADLLDALISFYISYGTEPTDLVLAIARAYLSTTGAVTP